MFDLDNSTNSIKPDELESYDNTFFSLSKPEIACNSYSLLSGAILDHEVDLKKPDSFDLEDNLSINSCLAFIDSFGNSKRPWIHTDAMYSCVTPLIINNKNNIKLMSSSYVGSSEIRQSNEYSEPFDFVFNKTQKSSNIQLKLSNSVEDDSAYSSCYHTQSSPKNNLKIVSNTNCLDTEEEATTPFDSSMLLSSSSCSSSPLSSLNPNLLFLPICSEYESVKDIIPNTDNSTDKIKNDKDLFKSTITAFDILAERCSELIELFDEPQINAKRKQFKNSRNTKPVDLQRSDSFKNTNSLNSAFLQRTLTFDPFMKSSVLLSSSSSSSCVSTSTSISTSTTSKPNFNSIRVLIINKSNDTKSIFCKSISEFVKCTQNTKEQNPNVLMSNTRQFMNGMKNYLLKNNVNNTELRILIEKERSRLDGRQILNIDSIIEDCLQSIVLRPLKAKIYYLIVDWLIADGAILTINKNIKLLNELGKDTNALSKYFCFNSEIVNQDIFKQLRNYYERMQCEYAPLVKLKYILYIINDLLGSIKDFGALMQDFGSTQIKDILPVIIYAFSKCQMYAIQIEIDYIWSLVNRSLLTNEAVYYLNVMSSACHALVNLNPSSRIINLNESVLDVYFPDERGQTLKMRTIPLREGTKCKEVVGLIASVFKIYNCEEYALYLYENGAELRLKSDEKPFEIRSEKIKNGSNVKFIYKQKFSNVLWSKSIENF